MAQDEELLLDVPEIPQCLFGDRERAQMHHHLDKGEIGRRIALTFEGRKPKAQWQAQEIHRGPVQGFGEIGEGVFQISVITMR